MEIFDTDKHYRNELEIDGAELASAFWLSPERNLIHSCIVVRSGRAHMQIDATPEQLRTIALILHANAARIEQFSRQTGTPIDGTCGKVKNGHTCTMPAGSTYPDCGPALHDFGGQD